MRFKVGWLVPQHVLALTHFDPVVTPEDFQQISVQTAKALQQVTGQSFHVLIDNRMIAETNQATLEMMLQAFPQLARPGLRWIVVILPESIKGQAGTMPTQKKGDIQLKYVDSLEDAQAHLASVDEQVDWATADPAFFVDTD